jgi:hypothetical protein
MEEFTIAQFFSHSDFDTPTKFICVWQREDLFLIRRPATSDVIVPERMAIDEAREYVAQIQEFLSQEVPNQARVAELRTINNLLVFQISQIERWEQSCEKLMSELNPSELPAIVYVYTKLQMPPDFTGKAREVHLSESLKAAQIHTLERLREMIHERVAQFEQRAKTLISDQDLRAIVAQIERDLDVLKLAPALFEAFSETLSEIILAAERRMESIRDQQKTDDCIANIKRVVSAIGPSTNQSALAKACSSIESLVEAFPHVKDGEEYRGAISQIQKYQLDQRKSLLDWVNRAERVDRKHTAETLLAEVAAAQDRFDSESDAAQIDDICRLLASAAERFGIVEAADQKLRDYVAAVRRLSERVLHSKDIKSGITCYREMMALRCIGANDSPNCSKVENEVLEVREVAKTHLVQLIGAMCSRVPETSEECRRLSEQSEGILNEVVSMADFSNLEVPIRSYLQTLTETARIIELRAADQQKLLRVRNFRRIAPNTLQLCESAIAEIRELQQTLNFPESYEQELNEVVTSIERRQAEFSDRLSQIACDLSTLSSYDAFKSLQRTYDQLEMIFDGSSRERDYRSLESDITNLRQIFERLIKIESKSAGATTIKGFQDCLRELEVSPDLQSLPDWANERIVGCRNRLRESITTASEQLTRWNSQLALLSTRQDIDSTRNAISSKVSLYAESDMSDAHKQLTVDLLALGDCLQVRAANTLQTEIDCEQALERAVEWRASHEGSVSPVVIERALLIEREIAERCANIKNESLRRWQQWITLIRDRSKALQVMSESAARSDTAAQLLKELAARQLILPPDIWDSESVFLELVQEQCKQILNCDREAQILLLFDQLPEEIKRTLCRRLAERIAIGLNTSEEVAASQRGN